MINRVSNVDVFSNDSFERLAKVIKNQEKKKLYKICSTESEVGIAIKELKVQGYNSEIEKFGNNINVYKIMPEMVELKEAEQNNCFKKLAWGRYCFQKCNSINGFTEYDFDDGSIWRTVTGEDGKQYLVKDVDDSDEEVVIRTKTASIAKTASYTTDTSINNVIKIVYSDDINPQFISDLLMSNAKQGLITLLDNKIDVLINEKAQQKNISDANALSGLKEYIAINISSNTISDLNSFNSVIDARIEEILKAMEIL